MLPKAVKKCSWLVRKASRHFTQYLLSYISSSFNPSILGRFSSQSLFIYSEQWIGEQLILENSIFSFIVSTLTIKIQDYDFELDLAHVKLTHFMVQC